MSTNANKSGGTFPPPDNSIAWNELITPDPDAAVKFYGELFGWSTETYPGSKPYTMLRSGERLFGGVMATPQPGVPTMWLNYIAIAEIETTVARAAELGATILLPPTDIGSAGRIAVLKDPQGATFGLHQPPAS